MGTCACNLTALMDFFDVGWLCISRFLLHDLIALFFTFLTVFCYPPNTHYNKRRTER
ncbi:hypothetical protein BDQ17DRAFT_830407 [Cyathus striatus]|nr:hypothetical protein BDQ17DRAFT_830407 [Cyathus striatus]